MAESYAELQALRLELKFSIAEMAELKGLKKSTYQGYESGRRSMPEGFVNSIREWRRRDLEFMAGLPARVDERILLDGSGCGFPVAGTGECYESDL